MPRTLPFVLLVCASMGCPRSTTQSETPPVEHPETPATPAPETTATGQSEQHGDDAGKQVGEQGAVGDACSSADDCESGICEGQGCEPDQGRCMDAKRMCTRDLRAYCGCDGETFRSSGSCPGRRYAHEGPCRDDGGSGG